MLRPPSDLPELVEGSFFFFDRAGKKEGWGFDKLSQVGFCERRFQMPGLIALIIAALVFWLVLKVVFLVGAIIIALVAAAIVYGIVQKYLGKAH